MPMTPLFPDANSPLIIKQAATGDCYLLAGIDCIYNLGEEARQLLKSKFKQTDEGVEVRIKHTSQSVYLASQKMHGKYIHQYDSKTNEDVFFIPNHKLNEIDNASGVTTNSLAIKILERLSSYYYVGAWDAEENFASFDAHNLNIERYDNDAVFVGNLVDFHFSGYKDKNGGGSVSAVWQLIHLKMLNQNEPVFIGMLYGQPDAYGTIHSGHALRVDKVIFKKNGDYDFVLVNPWDNQKTEVFSLAEMQKRLIYFGYYSDNQAKHEITHYLLTHCSMEQGQYVFKNPELFNVLYDMKQYNLLHNMQTCIDLHQKSPDLIIGYNKLPPEKQTVFLQCIANFNGNVIQFNQLLELRGVYTLPVSHYTVPNNYPQGHPIYQYVLPEKSSEPRYSILPLYPQNQLPAILPPPSNTLPKYQSPSILPPPPKQQNPSSSSHVQPGSTDQKPPYSPPIVQNIKPVLFDRGQTYEVSCSTRADGMAIEATLRQQGVVVNALYNSRGYWRLDCAKKVIDTHKTIEATLTNFPFTQQQPLHPLSPATASSSQQGYNLQFFKGATLHADANQQPTDEKNNTSEYKRSS